MSNVAVLGLGAMGVRMAHNLIAAGHTVVVYNRTAERAKPLVDEGATLARSPREAAEKSDIVISMVTDKDASRAIWLAADTGALAGLRSGSVAVESSTLPPDWMVELAAKVTAKGAEFLDAPVAGSRPQVEAKQLVFLVGGEASTFDKARNVLADAGSQKVVHAGPVGSGATIKLAVNALFGIQIAAFSEIVGMVTRSGISREKAIAMLGGMPITSPALQRIAGLIDSRSYSPNFPIDLVAKDFRYVVENAERVGATAPMASAARDVYAQGSEEGHGGDDISGIAQLFD